MKKALIFDFDNTIFPVSSIGDELFDPVFRLIDEDGGYKGNMQQIKKDIMSKPFQAVAKEYQFSESLDKKCFQILVNLTYHNTLKPFDDYYNIRDLPQLKFLVTAGFTKMQQSKIDNLPVKNDFKETIILDPMLTEKTKKDVFIDIMERYDLKNDEVLVIGDDPNSEIRFARELGVDAMLYDKAGLNENIPESEKSNDLTDVKKYLDD